jgi:hypothetical protein
VANRDHAALSGALNLSIDPPSAPEKMPPGRAKTYLTDSLNKAGCNDIHKDKVRRDLALNCDLKILRRTRGFDDLVKDLARLLAR